jgi:2-methylcitrate dehydratase PrpD
MEEHCFSKDLIEVVDCGTDEKAHDILIFHNPKTVDEGRFSMEFCVALAIIDKGVRVADFCENRLRDPQVLEMMKKIKMSVDSEIIRLGYDKRSAANIKIKLIDGREYRTLSLPKGIVERPISDNDLIKKYKDCAGLVLEKESLERSIELILNLEKLDDIRKLTQVLVSKLNTSVN